MNHKFKITSIVEHSFIKIDMLQDITKENMKAYMSHGVWVLFGRKENQSWICFQVGQSSNIGSEIISDVECLSGKREICEGTKCSYINQF